MRKFNIAFGFVVTAMLTLGAGSAFACDGHAEREAETKTATAKPAKAEKAQKADGADSDKDCDKGSKGKKGEAKKEAIL